MMSKNVKISVVIPVYNEEKFIRQCLEAVSKQTQPPDEIIVVDNNSTDNTVSIARQFDSVTVVHEKSQSRGSSRRRGFDTASGDILVRIDADSRPRENWLHTIAGDFSEIEGLQGWSGWIGSYDARQKRCAVWVYNMFVFSVTRLVSGHHNLFGANMAITKRVWEKHRSSIRDSEDIYEDLEIATVLAAHNEPLYVQRAVVVDISQRAAHDSVSHIWWRIMRQWPATYRQVNWRAYVLVWPFALSGFLLTIIGKLLYFGSLRDRTRL